MLNDKQRRVVFDLPGNTIVSASPGTGKTKTLVARALHKLTSLPLHKSLALITYTNAGADEIASRLINNENNIFVGTIHRFCLEYILRPFNWLYAWHRPRIVTYAEKIEFVETNTHIDLGKNPLDELNKIKKLLDGELDINIEWSNDQPIEYVANLYYNFLITKQAIDFNEILYRSYKLISENEFIVNSLANKFYEISVDEFQDTNIFQYEILKAINRKHICTFFMVGDEKQKILRFAGAIDNAFTKASADFDTTIEILEVTYRSTTNIINAYSALFENHPVLINESQYKAMDRKIIFRNTQSSHNIIIRLIDYFTREKNINPSEIAVLSVRWYEALNVSKILRNKYPIVGFGALPHKHLHSSTFNLIRCISKFLYSTSVKNLRVIRRNIELHVLENNLVVNDSDFNSLMNIFISRISKIDRSIPLLQGISELQTVFDSIFKTSDSNFNEILTLLEKDDSNFWTFGKYTETLSGVSGITINIIHQVKGLEYEVVILNGINEGIIPYQGIDYPLSEEIMEDGKKLLYVGISRAKSTLVVLHNHTPSIFLSIIKSNDPVISL